MVILASQSPRRRELLSQLHIPFTVRVADVDEHITPGTDPGEAVKALSLSKALAVSREPEDVVIAADTVVVLEGQILGKPGSSREAAQMLQRLSGKTHRVMTGVTVLRGGKSLSCTEVTQVEFRQLSEGEIRRYVQSGEPMDKAGAYGIQGGAAVFVSGLRGDYFNVVGLPLCRLWQMLHQLAPEILEELQ